MFRGDLKGMFKPLSFMYGTKAFAPGSVAWTKVNNMLTSGNVGG
jgi:hypothetical protein